MTAVLDRLRSWFGTSRPRRGTRPRVAGSAAETLEDRVLLDASAGARFNVQIAGRTSDNQWWTAGYSDEAGTFKNEQFAGWNAGVNWINVLHGNFDGDPLQDVAARDPATGNWYVSLSDGIGTTTKLAGNWTTATTWSDVVAIDLPADGDRGQQGHFTNTSDIVGRAGDGTWWAAVSLGDGTFRNFRLDAWNPNAGWRDVRVLDINSDDAPDIVGRASDGTWWALKSGTNGYSTVFLARWNEGADWRDVRAATDFFGNGRDALLGRASDGVWYGLSFSASGVATTKTVGRWVEAAGWRDVIATRFDADGSAELLGRTSTGEWYLSKWIGNALNTFRVGSWNETAAWRDVQSLDAAGTGNRGLVGRTSGGQWWMSRLNTDGGLTTTYLGSWNGAAVWRDVRVTYVTQLPVVVTRSILSGGSVENIGVVVTGRRTGTNVTVENSTSPSNQAGLRITFKVASGETQVWLVYPAGGAGTVNWSVSFVGHNGVDLYTNKSNKSSTAYGYSGNDILDGRANAVLDTFFGGDGTDSLLGDGPDVLTQ